MVSVIIANANKEMTRRASGRRIRCPGGYSAFVPNPLPPPLRWTTDLVNALSVADRAVGRLAAEGRRLPNPHLLIRPFVKREAVLSSRIEGTEASLGELLAAEAGAAVERSPSDLREVANYVSALEYGVRRLKKLPLSLRLVREMHERLMRGVRGESAAPGQFRRSQNWIGRAGGTIENATYVPPPPHLLHECLGPWEAFLHETSLPPLVQVGLAHSQFEAIHPFLDGNGRVGRLVITLFLVERKILPAPLLYLSAFFESTRQEYYNRLRGITESGEWDAWILYFLSGVARQSEDAVSRAERINALLAIWRLGPAGRSSSLVSSMIDHLAENPFCTVNGMGEKLNVAFTTAQRSIGRLESAGILFRVSAGKRNRVYCGQALLSILEEPA